MLIPKILRLPQKTMKALRDQTNQTLVIHKNLKLCRNQNTLKTGTLLKNQAVSDCPDTTT